MFANMHDRTRRTLCRGAFVLLCVLPSACVLGLSLYRHTPIYRSAIKSRWEQAFFQRLGLITTIDGVRQPDHQSLTLEGIKLVDPETGELLARVRVLELAESDHRHVLLASQPEIEPGQFARLCRVLDDRILRGPPLDGEVQFLARELTLLGENGQTFTDVQCSVGQHQAGIQLLVGFRLAGAAESAAAQLQILRNRQLSPPATGWHLRTGSTPLPCSIFKDYVPLLQNLGPACRFNGAVWADAANHRWSGEIAGRFTHVDLDKLIAPFPHKLSGTAELFFQRARFDDGRLLDAAGTIETDGGVISRSLVEAMGESLQLRRPRDTSPDPAQLMRYSHLACGYELTATQLRLSGTCPNAPTGTILLGTSGPLLTESTIRSIPAVALARALSPGSQFQVPATRETRLLVDSLPIPTAGPSPVRQAKQQRHVPLRLRKR